MELHDWKPLAARGLGKLGGGLGFMTDEWHIEALEGGLRRSKEKREVKVRSGRVVGLDGVAAVCCLSKDDKEDRRDSQSEGSTVCE